MGDFILLHPQGFLDPVQDNGADALVATELADDRCRRWLGLDPTEAGVLVGFRGYFGHEFWGFVGIIGKREKERAKGWVRGLSPSQSRVPLLRALGGYTQEVTRQEEHRRS